MKSVKSDKVGNLKLIEAIIFDLTKLLIFNNSQL